MAIATSDQQNTGIKRGRGGFYRGANDVPWIADPSGATTTWPGKKDELIALCRERGIDWRSDLDIDPGKLPTIAQLQELLGPRPKRVAYGSPSNRGKQIENTTNLVKWGERRVVLGIGADPALVEMCAKLTALELDSDEYRTLADAIIIAAKDAANTSLAADRGTHGHALAEDSDGGHDWLRRAEEGEDLGLDAGVQAALVQAWRDMLAANGLEVLAVEASCVDDTWRLAGTLDRIVRCARELRFTRATGEITVVPAGTVLVLDVKTGKRRTDDRTGAPLFWQAYAIQIASYAQSVPYDTQAETRGTWPWPIDQTHALIAHLDIEAALVGDARCELVHVDLVAGREHGGECVVQAKAWEKRDDVFSVAQLAADSEWVPVSIEHTADNEQFAMANPIADGGLSPSVDGPASTTGAETDLPPSPPAAPVVLTPAEQHAIVRGRAADEGHPVDDGSFDTLQTHYRRLEAAARAWVEGLSRQAQQAGVSFHAKGNRTRRRYELLRALVILAQRGDDNDQAVRDLLEPIIGDCAQFAAVAVGALVGSLSATEATQFADVVDGRLAIFVQPDGKTTLQPAA